MTKDSMEEKRRALLMRWVEGTYALGWRGWLAEKLLRPVVNEILVKTN